MLTPVRRRLYDEIAQLNIENAVLDIGGSRTSGYHELIKGNHIVTVVNLDETYGYDLKVDLEKPFPLKDNTYDAVLAFNVLEHIFDYNNLLAESFRVLKKGGQCIINVPFLVQFHPCPHDYWRYSEETLEKIFFTAGFVDVSVRPLGKGPFTASAQMIAGAVRMPLVRWAVEGCASVLDSMVSIFVPKVVLLKRYPLAYFVIAEKPQQ